jgi:hypothetical protein
MDFSLFSWRKKRPIAGKRSYQLLAALNRGPRKYQHFASYLQQDSVRGSLPAVRLPKVWFKVLGIGFFVLAALWALIWMVQESLAAFALFSA